MKTFNLVVILLLIIVSNLYSQTQEVFGIKECIDKTTSLIPGDVIKIEKKFVSNKGIWEVKSIAESGSEINYKINLDDGSWIQMVSGDGPFDYDFTPQDGHVSFQTAKAAVEESLGTKMLKWEYRLNKDKWEYGFWHLTKTGRPQIRVDAESGKIVTKSRGRGN